ncbi:DNA repair protein [Micromonospora sp. NPDC006766]|uniref:DNA repair protein n=1 Tax=Micromonospora sp. NPDC006766 TaxID=3154778 RepID=UPI00340F41DA
MPNQPKDRHQHIARNVPTTTAGRFPAQPPYREARNTRPLSWAELNALPAVTPSRPGDDTRRGTTLA